MEEDNDNEEGMNLNDVDSGTQLEESKARIKIIIITILITLFLLIIATVIFIIFLPHIIKLINEIICKYNIKDNSKNTSILSDEFNLDSNITIYINDKKIENAKSYNFSKPVEYTIKYKINNSQINLDYIFKGINSLISVEMKSNKN